MDSKPARAAKRKRPVGRPRKPKKAGRPLKVINERDIVTLTAVGYTAEAVAIQCGISKWLLFKRFKSALQKGRVLRDGELQHKQFQIAMQGSPTLLRWLGANWLSQSDRIQHMSDNPLDAILAAMRQESARISAAEEKALPRLLPIEVSGNRSQSQGG